MNRAILAAAVLGIVLGASACSGAVAHTVAPSPSATPTNQPLQACLQLQNFGLHNHGQGISPAFSRELDQETTGSPMYADTVQWLNGLAAPIPTTSGDAVTRIQQVLTDAQAVGADCQNDYGVRNVMTG